jgi:hypothetical protein
MGGYFFVHTVHIKFKSALRGLSDASIAGFRQCCTKGEDERFNRGTSALIGEF